MNICKIFKETKIYYIKSDSNPSDLGTKFDRFKDAHLQLGEESKFRNSPNCKNKGIDFVIASKDLVPLDRLTLSAEEKDIAALEIVKLHQLIVTRVFTETPTIFQPKDTTDEETI